jgi:hypothetical protein
MCDQLVPALAVIDQAKAMHAKARSDSRDRLAATLKEWADLADPLIRRLENVATSLWQQVLADQSWVQDQIDALRESIQLVPPSAFAVLKREGVNIPTNVQSREVAQLLAVTMVHEENESTWEVVIESAQRFSSVVEHLDTKIANDPLWAGLVALDPGKLTWYRYLAVMVLHRCLRTASVSTPTGEHIVEVVGRRSNPAAALRVMLHDNPTELQFQEAVLLEHLCHGAALVNNTPRDTMQMYTELGSRAALLCISLMK